MMKGKKRIIFAISTSMAGGAQIYLYNIVEYIKEDFSVLVLCPKGFFYDKVKKLDGVEVVEQGISFGNVGRLRHLLEKETGTHGEVYVNAHLLGTGLWMSEAMKGVPNVHLSIVAHNKVIYDNISIPRKILYPFFIRHMSKRTSGFIAVSQEIADSVTTYTGRNCEYIPSSVPIKGEPKDVSKYTPDKSDIVIGFVGRISLQKNPVRFVETAALIAKEMPNVKFRVIGDGDLREVMEDCIRANKMEYRFTMMGFLSNPADEMKKLDLLLLTSDYEGTPMVLLEAMSYGIPVVSTRVGGIPTVIESGKDGMLTDNFEPNVIAKAVVDLLSDAMRYKVVSKAAFCKIKDVFSYESNISKFMNIVLNGDTNES